MNGFYAQPVVFAEWYDPSGLDSYLLASWLSHEDVGVAYVFDQDSVTVVINTA